MSCKLVWAATTVVLSIMRNERHLLNTYTDRALRRIRDLLKGRQLLLKVPCSHGPTAVANVSCAPAHCRLYLQALSADAQPMLGTVGMQQTLILTFSN